MFKYFLGALALQATRIGATPGIPTASTAVTLFPTTRSPTGAPITLNPTTPYPSFSPSTYNPSAMPTFDPTAYTNPPTWTPTVGPSNQPSTWWPTWLPSWNPSSQPTPSPTVLHTPRPTTKPTPQPTSVPVLQALSGYTLATVSIKPGQCATLVIYGRFSDGIERPIINGVHAIVEVFSSNHQVIQVAEYAQDGTIVLQSIGNGKVHMSYRINGGPGQSFWMTVWPQQGTFRDWVH